MELPANGTSESVKGDLESLIDGHRGHFTLIAEIHIRFPALAVDKITGLIHYML